MANNKTERRARLAAAKKARNNAKVNMFSPEVRVKIVGINNSPNAKEALYGKAKLRAPNRFTGTAFNGTLNNGEKREIFRAGLPTRTFFDTTYENNLQARTLRLQNRNNNARTKRASSSNGWTETGKSYIFRRTPSNARNARQHRATIVAATKNPEEAGYTVAKPTPKSLKNAETAHNFAENIHRKQTTRKGRFGKWFENCFGGECKIAPEPQPGRENTVTVTPPAISIRQAELIGGKKTRRRKN